MCRLLILYSFISLHCNSTVVLSTLVGQLLIYNSDLRFGLNSTPLLSFFHVLVFLLIASYIVIHGVGQQQAKVFTDSHVRL